MKPKIVTIKNRKQGSSDPDSNWAQARYAWTCQLLARFGRLERTPSHGPIERKFDQHLLQKLDLDQIVWWDETHRKCLIGTSSNPNKNYHILFPRNEEGQFNVEGKYSKERKSKLNVKYEKECRLGLGVAMVTPLSDDGTPLPSVGKRCAPFDYTSKVIVSVDDYHKLMKIEFQRVKSLKGNNGYWILSTRDPNIIHYQNDPVSNIKGVGKKTKELLEEVGIKTVGDVKRIESPTEMEKMLLQKKYHCKGLPSIGLKPDKPRTRMHQSTLTIGSVQIPISLSLVMSIGKRIFRSQRLSVTLPTSVIMWNI